MLPEDMEVAFTGNGPASWVWQTNSTPLKVPGGCSPSSPYSPIAFLFVISGEGTEGHSRASSPVSSLDFVPKLPSSEGGEHSEDTWG